MASQVDREFRVISALHKVGFPVPRPLTYCSDAAVIGTSFYVMEHVKVCRTHACWGGGRGMLLGYSFSLSGKGISRFHNP